MKITVQVEVPDEERCTYCSKYDLIYDRCRQFNAPILECTRQPCPACIEARKLAVEVKQ